MTTTELQFLPRDRMISGSKSGYFSQHPDNVIVFNANICVKGKGKVWWGDLDVTLDEPHLKEFARQTGDTLYILRERDARFDTETAPLYQNAVAVITPDGTVTYNK